MFTVSAVKDNIAVSLVRCLKECVSPSLLSALTDHDIFFMGISVSERKFIVKIKLLVVLIFRNVFSTLLVTFNSLY